MKDWITELYYKEITIKATANAPLTREFLIRQGTCCGSGCTNCPYIPKHTKGNTTLKTNFN